MKKNRLLAAAAIAVAAGLALAGCASGGATTDNSGVASTKLKDSITYALWDPNQEPVMKQIIKAFNEKYPNIKVTTEVSPYAQYWTKLQTEASSNTLPDVFWMNMPYFKLYAQNGQLAPMTPEIDAKQIDTANYPKAITKFFSVDGKQYGVPKDIDTTAMWINTKLFADAGVEIPEDGWTWDDYKQKAAEITDKLGSQGIYGTVFEMIGQSTWYSSVFQAGGTVISADGKKSGWDSAEAREGIQLWADLIKSGDAPTVAQVTDTFGFQWFTSGKAAMYPMFPGGTVAIMSQSPDKADYRVVTLPKGKVQATVGHSLTNVVSAKSKHLKAAQAFQAFVSGKEAALIQAKSGVAMPAFNGTSKAFVDSIPSFHLQAFEDEVPYAVPYPASVNTDAWFADENKLIPQAISGQLTVKEATSQLADDMNAALAKEK